MSIHQAVKNKDSHLRPIDCIKFFISFQSRQQYYTANDSHRQQQLQSSSDKYSRLNHVPRTSSSGRIRSNTTTPTAIAMNAISQPVPTAPIPKPPTTTMTVESTPGATVPSNNPGSGDGGWSEHKPSTNNINNPANPGHAFNGYESHG